ncbi:hypothetical protein PCI56_00365 [Plesiomonas shigelloides subsp. oncorhynchi]|nr:hypothetical protein [Plesiomonas shigelloides]
MNNHKINQEYVNAYTNASLLVRPDFGFEDGLFTGYDAEKRKYDKSTWAYQLDENGFAKRDPSCKIRSVSGICSNSTSAATRLKSSAICAVRRKRISSPSAS